MPTITIKNIPNTLYEDLKQVAVGNHRSINSEVIVCLERALGARKIDEEEVLHRARRLRELTCGWPISNAELTKAKRAGRR